MESDSRSGWQGKGALEELMRERIRATIESIVEEELDGRAGCGTIAARRFGSSRLPARQARANADDQPGCDHDRHAAGTNRG